MSTEFNYNSAEMVVGTLAIGRGAIVSATGDPTSASVGSEILLFFNTEEVWQGGDVIGPEYLVDTFYPPNGFTRSMSQVKRLGHFPLGAITDGVDSDPEPPLVDGVYVGFFGDPTGYEDESSQPRSGPVHFLPDAHFRDGSPGRKGFVPRADEWFESSSIWQLIYDRSELLPWWPDGFKVGTPDAGSGPGLYLALGTFNYLEVGSAFIGRQGFFTYYDFDPRQGHIIRFCTFRDRVTFEGVVTPTPPPTPGYTEVDLGLLADVDLNDLNWAIGVFVTASQFFAASNDWQSWTTSNIRGIVGFNQHYGFPQNPGDLFYILDNQNLILYIIHGTIVSAPF